MKELTPSSRQMFFMLLSKHKSFSQKNRLDKDGSFYYADTRLAEELYQSPKTVLRSKRLLVQHGYIRIQPGVCKGWATKYWVTPKGDKMSCFGIGKDDKLSAKDVNLSLKACQNVTPNKVIIKKENKENSVFEDQDLRNLTEEQKDGIRAGISVYGSREKTIEFFLNRGYERDVLENVLAEPNVERR